MTARYRSGNRTGHVGFPAYTKVVIALMQRPRTINELTDLVGLKRETLSHLLCRLRLNKLAYLRTTKVVTANGNRCAVWAWGSRRDDPRAVDLVRLEKPRVHRHHIAFCEVIKALHQPHSIAEAAAASGDWPHLVRRMVRDLEAGGVLRIVDWRIICNGRVLVPLWQLGASCGPALHAPKPELSPVRRVYDYQARKQREALAREHAERMRIEREQRARQCLRMSSVFHLAMDDTLPTTAQLEIS